MPECIDQQSCEALWAFPAALGPALSGLTLSPGRAESQAGAVAVLETGPRGAQGLSHLEAGRKVRLASAVDPAAEDRALVERFGPDPGQGALCLGLGLGYHLEELDRCLAPGAPLWVLESRPELAACALMSRDFSRLLARPGFRLFIGPFDGQPWGPDEMPPTQILWRPATARHFAAEYPLKTAAPSPRPRLAERRILLFQGGYFLDQELGRAAEALGHTTAVWRFQRGATGRGDDFKELLSLIKNFRPDLVLTVNHLGFDAEGIMDDLFTRLKLPVASWFVDSPAFILGRSRPSPYLGVFSWDRDYLPLLRDKGFARAAYLPLATDETVFKPGSESRARAAAFVGDSLNAATFKYLGKFGLTARSPRLADFLAQADGLAADFLETGGLLPDPAGLRGLAADFDLSLDENELESLAALITWRASRLWRVRVLKAFSPLDLTVAGDDGWAGLLNLPPEKLRPPLDYYRELAPFYQTSAVNLNITSAQMKTGLNQRVFDVPACGAFLLTDRRGQIDDLFEPGREVATYQSPAEAAELAAWYLAHPGARAEIAAAARRRVLAGHLYRHRLAALIQAMSE